MSLTAAHHAAAGAIVDLVVAQLGAEDRSVHGPTAVASCARLAGSLLFRSWSLDVHDAAPGAIVLSEEAGSQTEPLVLLLTAVVQRLLPDTGGVSTEPIADWPVDLDVVQSLERLQAGALHIAQEQGLSFVDASHAATLATAFLIHQCANDLPPAVGLAIATDGVVTGARTVPPPLPEAPKAKKPWWRPW